MLSYRSILIGVCLAVPALVPAVASADLTTPEQISLDTYDGDNGRAAGPIYTAATLTAGAYYAAEVEGTWSAYMPSLMAGTVSGFTVCGAPESAPQYATPDRPSSRTNADAQFNFAAAEKDTCTGKLTGPSQQFQINAGGPAGYFHINANGGTAAGPSADHKYVFLFQGAGTFGKFRMLDEGTADNNGILKVTVRPATLSDCAGAAACIAALPTTPVAPVTPVITPGTPPRGDTPGGGSPGSTPSTPGGPSKTPGTTTPGTSETTASKGLTLTTSKACISRRQFLLRVVTKKVDPVVKATVTVKGKRIKVARVKLDKKFRRVSFIDLRGLPAGKVVVKIKATTKSGKKLNGSRTYTTCKAKSTTKKSPKL